jgi:hypothetical protein
VVIKVWQAATLSKGMGLKAGNKPMATYTRRPGERHGSNWYIPNVSQSSEFRHVAFDANAWKTFVHAGREGDSLPQVRLPGLAGHLHARTGQGHSAPTSLPELRATLGNVRAAGGGMKDIPAI